MLVEILISLWDSGKLVFNEVKIISLQIANFKMKKKKKKIFTDVKIAIINLYMENFLQRHNKPTKQYKINAKKNNLRNNPV